MLLTPFAANGSYIITLHSVFLQGIRVLDTLSLYVYVTGPAKIDHLSAKDCRFLACLLYHNLITIYTIATESLSLLQNLMRFLL